MLRRRMKMMICEECGFIHEVETVGEYGNETSYHCLCCDLYDVEFV
jgi:hypothetical protein